MNREYRKKQLRRQLINTNVDNNRSKIQVALTKHLYIKTHKKCLIMIIVLLFLLGAWIAYGFYYQSNYFFTNYETIWETAIIEGSLVGYKPFGNNALKVTKDGVSYLDNKGKTIWTESYEMKNPTVSVNNNYAVVADKQNNNIYIYNVDGIQGHATTVYPISKVVISSIGTVAAVLEDANSSHIMFFRKDGTPLDISITTHMAKSGYPIDISLSDDGTQLMASYVFFQNGELNNRVVFYDFSEIGKNIPGRLVGGFEEQFQGTLVGSVQFLENPYSCVFSTGGVDFFSSKNQTSPIHIAKIPVEEEIQSVFNSPEYVGIIVNNNSEDFINRIELYKKDGELVMKRNFNFDYKEVMFNDNLIILLNDDSCNIYNIAGNLKFCGSFDFNVSTIRKGRYHNTLVVTGPQVIKEIRLH